MDYSIMKNTNQDSVYKWIAKGKELNAVSAPAPSTATEKKVSEDIQKQIKEVKEQVVEAKEKAAIIEKAPEVAKEVTSDKPTAKEQIMAIAEALGITKDDA